MISFLRWILGLAMIVASVFFALANRDPVSVTWSPVHPSITMPVFAVGLGGLILGMLTGALMIWLDGGELRRDARRQRRLVRTLEDELSEERSRDTEPASAASTLPAPPRILPFFSRGGRSIDRRGRHAV